MPNGISTITKPKPQGFQNIPSKFKNQTGNSFYIMAKSSFLEILKAVCLSVDLVPKVIQKFSQKMEQKLVPRCETEIVANACHASYEVFCCDQPLQLSKQYLHNSQFLHNLGRKKPCPHLGTYPN